MKRRRARWHALSRSRQRPLPHLDKERSENVEVGRGDIMKKLLLLTLALFRRDFGFSAITA
jgi:hypothetical protein